MLSSPNQLSLPLQDTPLLHAYPGSAKFSWASELHHLLSSKFLKIVWWPVFQLRRRHITHSPILKPCKKLPGFDELLRTIQKAAFAYDGLFLNLAPFRYHPTSLADITTLAILFGDEFYDGIAETAGKPFIQNLVAKDPAALYLEVTVNGNSPCLKFCSDIENILPSQVKQSVNKKYGITYSEFYQLLRLMLQLFNQHLGKFDPAKATTVAEKITALCNGCLKTFLHDVNTPASAGNPREVAEVLHFHDSKAAFVQKKLLEFRCLLAGKEELMNSSQAAGWMDIVRVLQIYDDIVDAVSDDGFQDNLLLSVAFHLFPEEWSWFCSQRGAFKANGHELLLLSLYMPRATEYCMQLASEKIRPMNWEQQKIMHYLLLKNKYVLHREGQQFTDDVQFLAQFYRQVKDKMQNASNPSIKSFVVDTCMHLLPARKHLLKKIYLSKAYQVRYNLFSIPAETKAAIFDEVTNGV